MATQPFCPLCNMPDVFHRCWLQRAGRLSVRTQIGAGQVPFRVR